MRAILTLAISLFTLSLFAQRPENSKLQGLALNCKDSILLRWAPSNFQLWSKYNSTGYVIKKIERDTLMKKTKSWIITKQPIKPAPMDFWEKFVDADDKYGSIAAQALYGESFEVNSGKPGDLISVIKENEQRFSFGLFSADHSFQIAKAMGLGYADHELKSNCVYSYVISPQLKLPKGQQPPTLILNTRLMKQERLPFVAQLKAENHNGSIMLSWPMKPYTGIYMDYIIERSIDNGKSYQVLNDIPVVNTTEQNMDSLNKGYVVDPSAPIHKTVMYRIKGSTPFDITGSPSKPIQVVPFFEISESPILVPPVELKGIATIRWEMPKDSAIIRGFIVEKSFSPLGPFKKLDSIAFIQNQHYEIKDNLPDEVNYYRVGAVGYENKIKYSLTKQLNIPDTIPPSAPKGLQGKISDKGIVTLLWDPNLEQDIKGYRVFRANKYEDQFAQITDSAVLKNNYKDSINLKTLNKYIYYQLVAVDRKFNPSNFSEILKVKIPDIIPPAPPSLTMIKSTVGGIALQWILSSSDDVVKHEILRSDNNKDFIVIKSLNDSTHNFLDEHTEFNVAYSYKIRAIDDSELFSESKIFSAKKLDLGIKPEIKNMSGLADRDNQQIVLKWKYDQSGVKNYIIYRSEKNKPLRLYKMVDGGDSIFLDQSLYINTQYQYRIKAQFGDGVESALSEKIVVNY